MKKNSVKFILICSLFMFFSISVFAEAAIITSVKGKVEVSRGGKEWTALSVGDKVSESDIISTGFQSEVRVKYNGSVVLLGALTRVTLNQLVSSSSGDKVDVFLNTGAVRSKVTHTADRKVSYSVRGPVAVASVRGTDFSCFASGKVKCFSGAVAVYPAKMFEETSKSETTGTESSEDDEESATATTPAKEINDSVPAGAVVVGKNQETSVSKIGRTEKTIDVSTNNISKIKNQLSSQGSKESVSVGGTKTEPEVKKASVSIKITIEE